MSKTLQNRGSLAWPEFRIYGFAIHLAGLVSVGRHRDRHAAPAPSALGRGRTSRSVATCGRMDCNRHLRPVLYG